MTGSTHVRVTLALVLAVSLAGCGAVNVPFLGGENADDGRAEQIASDSVAEMQSVSSYNFTMRNVVEFGQNRLNMTADGRVNHTSERLYMDAVLSLDTNTTRSKEFSQLYVLGDTRCRSTNDNGERTWDVSENATDAWNQGLSLDAQAAVLNASGTDAELRSNQTVRGEQAYVVRISPDSTALKRVVSSESGVDLTNVAIQNATITQYVAQDDSHLLQSTMRVDYRVDGQPTSVDVDMTYSDYGDVPPIDPPQKGKKAGCTANASSNSIAA